MVAAKGRAGRLCHLVIRAFALLAPHDERTRWRNEWLAEIEHAERRGHGSAALLRRSLLSARDALALRVRRSARQAPNILRQARGGLFDEIRQDVRFGIRSLCSSPGFTAVAVLTMAIGIGATTTIFGLINGILLRPLPYEDPDRLVVVWPENWFSTDMFLMIGPFLDSFDATAGFTGTDHTLLRSDGAVRIKGPRATAGFFDVLGPRMQLGRGFETGEDTPGDAVAVVSDSFWRTDLGADPAAIGRTVRLDGREHTVVGVLSPGYQLLQNGASVVTPWPLDTESPSASSQDMKLIARLAKDASPAAALEELRTFVNYLRERNGWGDEFGRDATIMPLQEYLVGDTRPTLLLLFGAVGLTLLIASANVANLLLSRALTREREIAVRVALGARRGRLMRQLLTESSLLGLLGILPGLALASVGLRGVLALMPPDAPRIETIAVDGWVLAFSALVALATGWIVGVIPALHASVSDVRAALTAGGRGGSETALRRRTRTAVVLAEIAMAVALVAGSGLLIRSFLQVMQVDPGFRPDGLVTFDLRPEQGRFSSAAEAKDFFARVRGDLGALPGVTAVSEVWKVPFSEDGGINALYRADREIDPAVDPPFGRWRPVSHDYLTTAGVRLVRGRLFTATDEEGTEPVAVISETAARQLFGAGQPLGQRLLSSVEMDTPVRVVGIVGDLRLGGLDQESPAVVYRPYDQLSELLERYDFYGRWIMLRFSGAAPASLPVTVREIVRDIDPSALVASYTAMNDAIRGSLSQRRATMTLLGLFAGAALLLGAIGIYGVLAYSVRSRRREFGIRLALGSTRGRIVRGVLSDALSLATLGSAIGLGLTMLLSRALESFLYDVSVFDPWVLTVAVVTTVVLAVLSALYPAVRAGREDPARALESSD